jgi:hypothetical protein
MNIPNFQDIPVIVKKGDDYFFSDEWRTILLALFETLQTNASNEGLVMPTQSAANITTIQNNQYTNGQYSTAYGTMIYDSTDNSVRIAINNGSNVPVFKTVTLT